MIFEGIVDMVEKKIADKHRGDVAARLDRQAVATDPDSRLGFWMGAAVNGWNYAAALADQFRDAKRWREKYDLVDEQRIRWLTNLAAVLGVEARMVMFALPEVAFEMLLQHLRAQQHALSDAVSMAAQLQRRVADLEADCNDLEAKLPP